MGHSSALSHDDFQKLAKLLKCITTWESQSSPLDGCAITSVQFCTPDFDGTSK